MTKNQALYEYALRLGDTSLVLGHRLSEWCGHAPLLEEDIALSNMALDLIGQSRLMLAYAGTLEGKGNDEDALAYHRDARQYRNLLLAEQPNGDFGYTIARHFLLSAYLVTLYQKLTKSSDETLNGFAQKSLKEMIYHLRHASDWMLRLGDGTPESKQRVQESLDACWLFTDDFFDADAVDAILQDGTAPDLADIKTTWLVTVTSVITLAGLQIPATTNGFMRSGSRKGNHTEYLGHLLADMQFIPRAYPGTKW
ncbi:MAG: phenylacetate-CoA oxygenase subunit PaaC [Bacteroidia bacterium]|nr:phenylacetate-CoA oxygenase subunit PaaC [Bacteroidia bacterium]